jgi:hypothetical protein
MAGKRPNRADIETFYAEYPVEYAACRTFGHGPERPYAVERPHGPHGIVEVTRICRCGRLVTRTYTATGRRIPTATRVASPTRPRYYALPGMGRVDAARIARRAIEADEEAVERKAARRTARASRN